MAWDMVKLGDVATYINGYAFKPSDWGVEGLPIIRIQNLTGNAYETNHFAGQYQAKYEVNDGDILISWSASLGVYEWNRGKALLNQHIFKVVFDKIDVHKKYFFYTVKHLLGAMLKDVHGATMKHITKPRFDNTPFPLPPLEEQKRIAAILDKAHSIRQKREQNLNNADALTKSIFLDMFGDPVTNLMGWEVISLQDAYEIIDGDRGINYPKQEDFSSEGHCLFLNTGNVTQEGFNFDKVQFITEIKENQLRKGKLQRGDIVLTTRGTVGNTAYFSDAVPYNNIRINSGMVILRSKNVLNPYFFLNLFAFKSVYAKLMSGTAQPQLPIGNLKDAKIINPKNLQNKFAEIVTQIEAQKAKQNQHLHEADQCFKALQQQFFG